RDFHVTGVQTCALPIWVLGKRVAIGRPTKRAAGPQHDVNSVAMGSERHIRQHAFAIQRAPRFRREDPLNTMIAYLVDEKGVPGEIGRASCRERGWISVG